MGSPERPRGWRTSRSTTRLFAVDRGVRLLEADARRQAQRPRLGETRAQVPRQDVDPLSWLAPLMPDSRSMLMMPRGDRGLDLMRGGFPKE